MAKKSKKAKSKTKKAKKGKKAVAAKKKKKKAAAAAARSGLVEIGRARLKAARVVLPSSLRMQAARPCRRPRPACISLRRHSGPRRREDLSARHPSSRADAVSTLDAELWPLRRLHARSLAKTRDVIGAARCGKLV